MRKVNSVETFKPTKENKKIIAAMQPYMSKSEFYNLLIKKYGEQLAATELNIQDFRKFMDTVEKVDLEV